MPDVFDYLDMVFSEAKQPKATGSNDRYLAWVTNTEPIFTDFGTDIYLSDFVNNAIDRIATEISKIDVKSIVRTDSAINVQNDDITRLFRFKPNPLQTTSDFLSNVEWLRRKHNNAFIYPQYQIIEMPSGQQYRRYLAFYPLNPREIYIGIGPDGEAWEVKMVFQSKTGGLSEFVLPYSDLIHMKWRRGANTVIGGGDDDGQPNDRALLRTIEALDKTIQGLPKSIESSLQIKGVYSAKTLADAKRLDNLRDEFESHITTSKSGIAAVDLAGDFTPVNIKAAEIPDTTLKFLKSVIEERYGVSAAILSGDYNGDQHSAFYQTAIEDFIVQFEQSSTATIFTQREQDVGHRVKCYYSTVNYMAPKDKMEMANLAKEIGNMTLNEINEMLGVPPFPEGNRRIQSLNYVNLEHVDAYQKSRVSPSRKSRQQPQQATR
ncbi:MAG: phage portal protein [Oscillospiraceae bacterium]